MKPLIKALAFSDIVLALLALIAPASFVELSSRFAEAIVGLTNPVAYAHAIILVAFATLASRVRTDPSAILPFRAAIIDVIIVIAGSVMLTKMVAVADEGTMVIDVISPYGWYVLSILFCIGNGHALAELTLILRNQRRTG